MPNRRLPKLLLTLMLVLGISLLQYCEDAEDGEEAPTQVQMTSSCADCHTDSDALGVLAVEESNGSEDSGEG